MSHFIKLCGITTHEDAIIACSHGADAVGFVFYDHSPRAISPSQAKAIITHLPPSLKTVGVVVDTPIHLLRDYLRELPLDFLQLHYETYSHALTTLSHDDPLWQHCIPAFRGTIDRLIEDISAYLSLSPIDYPMILIDAFSSAGFGGTGESLTLEVATQVITHTAQKARVILAGGLTPQSVYQKIVTVMPYGVDVSSGIESSPGKKSEKKIQSFIFEARRGFQALNQHAG